LSNLKGDVKQTTAFAQLPDAFYLTPADDQ
jgi:hypothetical protein